MEYWLFWWNIGILISNHSFHVSWVTLCYSWHKKPRSSALFDGLWPCVLPLDHIPGVFNDRSGVWAGHDRVLVWWSSIHTLLAWLCCMGHCPAGKKQSFELRNIVRGEGSKFSSRTTLYVAWVMCISFTQVSADAQYLVSLIESEIGSFFQDIPIIKCFLKVFVD